MNTVYRITKRSMSNLSELRNKVPPENVININKLYHQQNSIKECVEKTQLELQYARVELASLKERFAVIEKTISANTHNTKTVKNHTFTGKQPFVPFGV